ncbi:hypothetical protein SeLEV6574_g02432 [Synchytrium endobioticum]|nr:hypothetical protein SeLEV6574_g02432 [Synchytrium endobioticum]
MRPPGMTIKPTPGIITTLLSGINHSLKGIMGNYTIITRMKDVWHATQTYLIFPSRTNLALLMEALCKNGLVSIMWGLLPILLESGEQQHAAIYYAVLMRAYAARGMRDQLTRALLHMLSVGVVPDADVLAAWIYGFMRRRGIYEDHGAVDILPSWALENSHSSVTAERSNDPQVVMELTPPEKTDDESSKSSIVYTPEMKDTLAHLLSAILDRLVRPITTDRSNYTPLSIRIHAPLASTYVEAICQLYGMEAALEYFHKFLLDYGVKPNAMYYNAMYRMLSTHHSQRYRLATELIYKDMVERYKIPPDKYICWSIIKPYVHTVQITPVRLWVRKMKKNGAVFDERLQWLLIWIYARLNDYRGMTSVYKNYIDSMELEARVQQHEQCVKVGGMAVVKKPDPAVPKKLTSFLRQELFRVTLLGYVDRKRISIWWKAHVRAHRRQLDALTRKQEKSQTADRKDLGGRYDVV